jgi:hypothetical protein
MREWKNLNNDEIYAIWKEYLRTDRLRNYDVLCLDPIKSKPMRLTPVEIILLVDELMDRLEVKNKE